MIHCKETWIRDRQIKETRGLYFNEMTILIVRTNS